MHSEIKGDCNSVSETSNISYRPGPSATSTRLPVVLYAQQSPSEQDWLSARSGISPVIYGSVEQSMSSKSSQSPTPPGGKRARLEDGTVTCRNGLPGIQPKRLFDFESQLKGKVVFWKRGDRSNYYEFGMLEAKHLLQDRSGYSHMFDPKHMCVIVDRIPKGTTFFTAGPIMSQTPLKLEVVEDLILSSNADTVKCMDELGFKHEFSIKDVMVEPTTIDILLDNENAKTFGTLRGSFSQSGTGYRLTETRQKMVMMSRRRKVFHNRVVETFERWEGERVTRVVKAK